MLRTFSLVLFFSCFFIAAPLQAQSGWTTDTEIIEITAAANKFIIHAKPRRNPTDCKDRSHFYLNYTMPGANKIYNLLLDAAVRNLTVKLYITGLCDIFDMSELSKASIIVKN